MSYTNIDLSIGQILGHYTVDATIRTFPALKGIHASVCMERGLFGLGNPFGDQAALQWVVKHSAPLGMKSGLTEIRTGSGSGIGMEIGTGMGVEVEIEVEGVEGSGIKGRDEVEGAKKGETEGGREREGANEDKEGVKETGIGTGTGTGTEGGVVVYGSGLYALTAVTGLIKNKVSPQLISLILPEVDLEELGHPKVNPVATVATLSWTPTKSNKIALVLIQILHNLLF